MSVAGAAFLQALMRPRLVFDIDGTLGFLTEAFVTALNARWGTGFVASQLTTYRVENMLPEEQANWLLEVFASPVTYANVAPDYSGIAAVQAFARAGFEVIVASDRSEDCRAVTEDWLDRWRVPHDDLRLGHGAKAALADDAGPDDPMVLFDDDPAKIALLRPGVRLYMPRRPWTPPEVPAGVTVFDQWSDVLAAHGVSPDQPIPQFSRDATA